MNMIRFFLYIFSLSVLLTGNLIAMDEDFIENKSVVGTHGRVATGIYYKIRGANNTVLDDGGGRNLSLQEDTPELLNHPNRSWYFVPTDDRIDYQIRSGQGVVLADEGRPQSSLFEGGNQDSKSHHWTVIPTSIVGKFIIRSGNNAVLEDTGNTRVAFVKSEGQESHSEEPHRLWEFVPLDFKLTATIDDFSYDPQILNLTGLVKPSYIQWMNIKNTIYASGETRTHISESVANQASWEFDASEMRAFLKPIKVTISAKIPPFNGGEYDTLTWSSEEVSLEGKKEFELKEATIDKKLSIPLPGMKRIYGITRWDNIDVSVPFQAIVKIEGLANRVSGTDFTPASASLDSEGILSLLRFSGFQGDVEQDEKSVTHKLTGTYHVRGALGGDAYVIIDPLPPRYKEATRAYNEYLKNQAKK